MILRLSIVKPCKDYDNSIHKKINCTPKYDQTSYTGRRVNEISLNTIPETNDSAKSYKPIVLSVKNNETESPRIFDSINHVRKLRKKFHRLKEKLDYSKRVNLILKALYTG